jgi:Secretion system C-terminal sorting domain
VSSCWNPQYQANGVIQATGMTVGQTYYLMIDGYAGDDCGFLLYRSRPLPVEWGGFTAVGDGQRVQVDWETTMEVNVASFTVQRGQRTGKGLDNMRWEDAALLRPHGNPDGSTYSHLDSPPYSNQPWFYRIQETDVNGVTSFSDVVAVELQGPDKAQLGRVYPNPSSTDLHFAYYAPEALDVRVALFDLSGRKAYQAEQSHYQAGNYELLAHVSHLPAGIYIYHLAVGASTFNGKLEIIH